MSALNQIWNEGRWSIIRSFSEFYLQRPGWTVAEFASADQARHSAEKISLRIKELPRLGRCDDCCELIEEVTRTTCECGRLLCQACCAYICDECGQHWCGDCLCDLYHEHIEDWEPIEGLPTDMSDLDESESIWDDINLNGSDDDRD